jgi:hypothetical protein
LDIVERALLFGSIFASGGSLLSAGALWLWHRHRRFMASLTTTTGRVVEIRECDVDGQQMYQPIVEFVADGHREPFRATDGGTYYGSLRWKIGDEHVVHYDPRSPATAQISHTTGHRFGAQMAGIFGVTFALIGIAALLGVAAPETAYGRFVLDALR